MTEEEFELLENLIECLRITQSNKYINFSNYLSEILELSYGASDLYWKKVNKARFGATMPGASKTSQREYKEIKKRLKKVSHEQARKIKQIKETHNFIHKDLSKVVYELKKAGLDNSSSPLMIESFFDNCEELEFLNNKRNTKKLK